MKIYKTYDFEDLKFNCWSGAVNTLRTIEIHDMEDEFMELLDSVFEEQTVDMTQVNDFIWFETDFIFEKLNIMGGS